MKGHDIKKTLKKLRSLGTFYIADQNPEHLETIRLYELDGALKLLPLGGRLLEIGAGTGWQAQALQKQGLM